MLGSNRKPSHTQPHKPFAKPTPGPFTPAAKRLANLQARSEFRHSNPTFIYPNQQPYSGSYEQTTARVVRSSSDCQMPGGYPTHPMRPSVQSDHFGRDAPNLMPQAPPLSSSSSTGSTPAPSTGIHSEPDAGPESVAKPEPEPSGRALLEQLVKQLEDRGLTKEEQRMLEHLRMMDYQGRVREAYHNKYPASGKGTSAQSSHKKWELFQEIGKKRIAKRKEAERERILRERREQLKIERERAEEEAMRLETRRIQAENLRVKWERDYQERVERDRRVLLEQQRQRDWLDELERDRLRRHVAILERQRLEERLNNALREQEWRRKEEERQMALQKAAMEQQAELERLLQAQSAQQLKMYTINAYETCWHHILKDGIPNDKLTYVEFPFPLFGNTPAPDQITYEAVKEFILSPLRRNSDNASKSDRSIVKDEMLRWHSDKFDCPKVLTKVQPNHRDDVKLASKLVFQHLHKMLESF